MFAGSTIVTSYIQSDHRRSVHGTSAGDARWRKIPYYGGDTLASPFSPLPSDSPRFGISVRGSLRTCLRRTAADVRLRFLRYFVTVPPRPRPKREVCWASSGYLGSLHRPEVRWERAWGPSSSHCPGCIYCSSSSKSLYISHHAFVYYAVPG